MANPKIRFKKEDGTEYPDWQARVIGEFANCFAGATPGTAVKEYWTDGIIPWMSSGEVNKKQIYFTDKKISKLGYDKCSTKMVKPNTVVMALAGQGKTRGTVAITRISLCTNQSLCAIETDETVFDDFLFYYLETQYDKLRLISSGDGTRGGLNLKLINAYSISIPCIEEQKKIADFLSNIDEIIKQSEAELKNLEEQKKGAMQKIFSQEVRFKREDGSDYPDWKKDKLENMVVFLDEKRKPIESKLRKKGCYPYYGASGIIDYVDDYIFDEELILLSEDGANIVDRNYRVCFLANGKYWVNNHAHCLRPKENFSSKFICEALERLNYEKYNTGSAQPKLNQEVCRKLILSYPCFEEQQKIADFFLSFDESISSVEQELEKWKELKKGLLQQMFV